VYGFKEKAGLTLGTLVLQGSAKIFLNRFFSLQNFVIFRPLQKTSAEVSGSCVMCLAGNDYATLLQ